MHLCTIAIVVVHICTVIVAHIVIILLVFSLSCLWRSPFSPQTSSHLWFLPPPPQPQLFNQHQTHTSLLNDFLSSIEAGDYLCALSSDAARLVPQQLADDESSSTNRVYFELLHRVESFLVLESEDGVARD